MIWFFKRKAQSMQWIQVSEHLPEEGKLVLCYTEVIGAYFLSKWSASRGWLDQDGGDMRIITHWLDMEIPFTFPITFKIDEELAKKYGMKLSNFTSPMKYES